MKEYKQNNEELEVIVSINGHKPPIMLFYNLATGNIIDKSGLLYEVTNWMIFPKPTR